MIVCFPAAVLVRRAAVRNSNIVMYCIYQNIYSAVFIDFIKSIKFVQELNLPPLPPKKGSPEPSGEDYSGSSAYNMAGCLRIQYPKYNSNLKF